MSLINFSCITDNNTTLNTFPSMPSIWSDYIGSIQLQSSTSKDVRISIVLKSNTGVTIDEWEVFSGETNTSGYLELNLGELMRDNLLTYLELDVASIYYLKENPLQLVLGDNSFYWKIDNVNIDGVNIDGTLDVPTGAAAPNTWIKPVLSWSTVENRLNDGLIELYADNTVLTDFDVYPQYKGITTVKSSLNHSNTTIDYESALPTTGKTPATDGMWLIWLNSIGGWDMYQFSLVEKNTKGKYGDKIESDKIGNNTGSIYSLFNKNTLIGKTSITSYKLEELGVSSSELKGLMTLDETPICYLVTNLVGDGSSQTNPSYLMPVEVKTNIKHTNYDFNQDVQVLVNPLNKNVLNIR